VDVDERRNCGRQRSNQGMEFVHGCVPPPRANRELSYSRDSSSGRHSSRACHKSPIRDRSRDKFAAVESERAPAIAGDDASALRPAANSPADRELEPRDPAPLAGPEAWIDRVLDGRYRILKLLGQGGMGAVFVAEHLTLHKPVAVKVVRAELAGNGDIAARFAREAMATAQFEHPHVASAIDYGTLPEGGAYLVMQLVGGRSLRRVLHAEQRLPWRRVCEIMAQVADALCAAERAGIIHRDLKPDNILIEQRPDGPDLVKVLDFGIAYVAPLPNAALDAPALTREGTVVGTPGYMSPEQALGDKVDHRTDLYTLGIVLWESVAGRRLWGSPDLAGVLAAQLTQPVPLLRATDGDLSVPAEFDALVQKLTARAPADRPDRAATVRDTLRRLARMPDPHAFPLRAVWARPRQLCERAWSGAWSGVARWHAQPQPTRVRAVAWTASCIALLVIALTVLSPRARVPAAGGAQPGAPTSAPAPATEGLSANLQSAAKAAVENVTPEPKLPAALVPASRTIMESEVGRDRRLAAAQLLAHRPAEDVPGYLRTIAEFEQERTCARRKALITRMQEQPDPRFFPTLNRLYKRRNGCGFLGLGDCYECIRPQMRETLEQLRSPAG
jgi:eukaryotic-like serine/threonine-protein kinase